MPGLEQHRFVLLDPETSRTLVDAQCKQDKRGDRKIHLVQEKATMLTQVQEWPALTIEDQVLLLRGDVVNSTAASGSRSSPPDCEYSMPTKPGARSAFIRAHIG